jgi:transposase
MARRSLFVRTIPKASRKDILDLYDKGLTTRQVATQLQISEPWARRVKQERRELGKVKNATSRKRTPRWALEAEQIKAAIKRQPDLTLDELKVELGTSLSRTTLCRALQALKLTLKKSVESY